MFYCYDCGSNNIEEFDNEVYCNDCGSAKVFDDEEENLEQRIMELLDDEDRKNFHRLLGILEG